MNLLELWKGNTIAINWIVLGCFRKAVIQRKSLFTFLVKASCLNLATVTPSGLILSGVKYFWVETTYSGKMVTSVFAKNVKTVPWMSCLLGNLRFLFVTDLKSFIYSMSIFLICISSSLFSIWLCKADCNVYGSRIENLG